MEYVLIADSSDGGCMRTCAVRTGDLEEQPKRCREGILGGRWVAALLFIVGVLCSSVSFAQGSPVALPVLTTARSAHELTTKEAARKYPVRLHVVVTYYDPYIDSRRPALFVADASGSVFVVLKGWPAVGFKAGQMLEVTGVTGSGDFAPIVAQAEAHVIGESHLPSTAPRVTMTDLLTAAHEGQWVEVEGVVHSVRQTEKNVFLSVVLRDGTLTALTVKAPGVDYDRLVDATVVIRGNAPPLFNHQGQMTGAQMVFPGLETLKVEEAAPADPFMLPVERVGGLLRYTPSVAFHHRVHIRGVVTLLWPGRLICLQDELKGLCARTDETTALDVGERVDVIGFPLIGEFTPTLDHALYRAVNGGAGDGVAVAALPIMAEEALRGDHDAVPVEIKAQLLREDRAASDPTLVLSAGNVIFSAILPSQSRQSVLPGLEEGSWVKVTGICSVQSDGTGRTTGAGFSIAKSFRILLRYPGDVVVVQRPSWWNAAHTLRVLALALAITLFALCSAVILSLRVRQQTAVIRSQLLETAALKDAAEAAHKAAEFQATHDGLTGVRNRNAIFELLHREFELAARFETMTGVMMLDLDHFKRVNDTHGHVAGDEAIKEAVRRVLEAVRSSDLVGRYGGEEFLIVLPLCDKEQVLACAERVRLAISAEPIVVQGRVVFMTASVGATVARAPLHQGQDALAAADSALYHAKNNGRNKVVFVELESHGVKDTMSSRA